MGTKMRLITEVVEDIKVINEETEDGKKNLYIEGIFLQGDITNRNGRMYESRILDKEVGRYVKEYVEKNRAYGELGHPNGPGINLDRVSHIVTELRKDGSNFMGKARITNTPMGKIVEGILNSGGQLGVSSRGMGSIVEKNGINMVQDDFYLATAADIVADPSAPDAYVNGIMEGKEWVWDNGLIKEKVVEQHKKEIKQVSRKSLEEAKLRIFKDFLSKL